MPIKTLAALLALAAAAPLGAQTPITPGQTVTGTLEEGDRRMEDGSLYDAYVIRGRPGDRVVVRMTSEDFDTYLHWGYEDDGAWVEEEENDDAGEGTDSRLVVRLDDDGRYQLRAAAFDEDQEGAYELRVSTTGQPRPVPIRVGQVIEGALAASDPEGEDGPEDHYVIRGRRGAQATIDVQSDDFDTYVRFGVWRDGELDEDEGDDDGGEGTNSQLVVEFEDDVEYRIVVRAFDGEGTGAYTLRVSEGDTSGEWDDEEEEGDDEEDEEGGEDWPATDSVVVYSGTGATVVPVTPLETVEAALEESSPRNEAGGYYQEFSYRARAGERLRVRVSSDDIDPYVALGRGTGARFAVIVEDDDSGPDLDAELGWTVEAAGQYTIRVFSADPGQTGEFVLRIRSGQEP